jgi:phospholipid transport system substrate-binding protein
MWYAVVALGVLFASSPPAARAATPLERTNELVDTFKQLKVAKEGETLTPAEREANKAVYKRLDEFYDFHTIASAPLAPHKAQLTAAQQAKIVPMFEELLRLVAYPRSSLFLSDANYSIKPTAKPEDVQMDASAPEQDLKTSVIFHWKNERGNWRIVDVSFDGVSLIQDYKNQFGRIISKEGGEALVKRLANRLDRERRDQRT